MQDPFLCRSIENTYGLLDSFSSRFQVAILNELFSLAYICSVLASNGFISKIPFAIDPDSLLC